MHVKHLQCNAPFDLFYITCATTYVTTITTFQCAYIIKIYLIVFYTVLTLIELASYLIIRICNKLMNVHLHINISLVVGLLLVNKVQIYKHNLLAIL